MGQHKASLTQGQEALFLRPSYLKPVEIQSRPLPAPEGREIQKYPGCLGVQGQAPMNSERDIFLSAAPIRTSRASSPGIRVETTFRMCISSA
jgi:hypothetical protein